MSECRQSRKPPQLEGNRQCPAVLTFVLVLADDLGYSDIGCYGGEIDTPNLDRLARSGLRMSQFYNTARCSPSRASLLTGLHPHQTGVGILVDDQRPWGYPGSLNDKCVTMAEVLRGHGYGTYMSGKWHLTGSWEEPNGTWPTERGFDRFFGTIAGAGSYFAPISLTRDEVHVDHDELPDDFYYTDAISDEAANFVNNHVAERPDDPFFLYVAYTAPHWPLHAKAKDVAAYDGRYDAGWDELRQQRMKRLQDEGLVESSWPLSERDPNVEAWHASPNHDWEARRMQVYAAQVTSMDEGIGRIVEALNAADQLDNTLLIFLSDNGGSPETYAAGYVDEMPAARQSVNRRTREGRRVFHGNVPDVMPGPDDTWGSYGRAWSNLSNTPFREHKSFAHEGGVSTPFIVHWPGELNESGVVRHTPHQLPDVMATVLDVTGARYPAGVLPPEGTSMLATWRDDESAHGEADRTLCWEHEGNAAVRRGRWKLVCKHPGEWELYDIVADRTELHDMAAAHPQVVDELVAAYDEWALRCGVIPREQILTHTNPW